MDELHSAWTGTRLYINGNAFPDTMISKGSYQQYRQQQRRASFNDASGGYHEELYPHKRTFISFSVRERNMEEHEEIAQLLKEREVQVEYWDDNECKYSTDTFFIETIEYRHESCAGSIRYMSTPVFMFTK